MTKFYQKNKSLGFTLIELLVVISVIGFIATAALIMINNARVSARNAKRNGDIVQLLKAFQLAMDNAGGVLPSFDINIEWPCVSSSVCSLSPAHNQKLDDFIGPYIKEPADPVGGGGNRPKGYNYYKEGYLHWYLEPVAVTSTVCGPGVPAVLPPPSPYFLECKAKVD